MIETAPSKTRSIVNEFANATMQKDYRIISDLLCDNGDYEIQTKSLDTRKANKKSFLKWFQTKLSKTQVTSVDYDQCIHCYIGNPVLLFNNGEFPFVPKDMSYRTKAGLMLDVQNGVIKRIKFCALVMNTDNPFVYERNIRKSIERGDPIDGF